MTDLRAEVLTRIGEWEKIAADATPGPWKLWAMSVMADPKGTSNLDDALLIADTSDPHRGLRTWNASFIAASRTVLPLLLSALRAEVDRHSRYGIYDECGHEHTEDDDALVVVECLDNPYTCEEGLVQAVCHECHTDDGEVRENTDEGEWPCAFIGRLHSALGLGV